MIGPLAKFVRASNMVKIVQRYFGKVWHESNMCIIQFDWLVALYIFTLLPRNTSLLIVNTVVSGKKSVMSTNHFARTSFWWVRACAHHLWFVYISNWHFSLHLPPLQHPGIYTVDNFQYLIFGSLPTSSQEIVRQESTFTFTFTLHTIYEVNVTSRYLERCWPATNNDEILAALLQHNEENFLKLTYKNRLKIDLNKSVPKRW